MASMHSDPNSHGVPLDQAIARQASQLRPVYADEIERLKWMGRRRRNLRRWGSVVAAGIGCLLLGAVSLAWRDVEAPSHAPRTVSLADGSRIDLDAAAVIQLPLAPWRHEARLVRGDAVFDIVHDDGRPFVVRVGSATLTDLGTRFLVQSFSSGGPSVAVFEGRVEVSSSAGHRVVLDAGQAAQASDTAITTTAMPSEAEATAWRQGRLVFRDAPLARVAATLSRYRSEPVEVASPAIAGLKVSGLFHLDDIDGGLHVLEQALPVEVRRRAERTILVARDGNSLRR